MEIIMPSDGWDFASMEEVHERLEENKKLADKGFQIKKAPGSDLNLNEIAYKPDENENIWKERYFKLYALFQSFMKEHC